MNGNHTFVICAYKDSPYLRECVKSLKKQTYQSAILLCTATPSKYLETVCGEYGLEYCVRVGQPSIGADWNYALSMAKTPYVTIAHQDDIYESDYVEKIMQMAEKQKSSLILFSDYYEMVDNQKCRNRLNLIIKRVLLYPLKNIKKQWKRGRKRSVICVGNAISCPTVTYHMQYIRAILENEHRNHLFQDHFRSNLDWEAWEWLSKQDGGFVYIPECLMSHRIHAESETSAVIADDRRRQEDYEMFCKFWPSWVAKLLSGVYSTSEKSNEV